MCVCVEGYVYVCVCVHSSHNNLKTEPVLPSLKIFAAGLAYYEIVISLFSAHFLSHCTAQSRLHYSHVKSLKYNSKSLSFRNVYKMKT